MQRLLRTEILRITGLTLAGAALGWYWDKPALGAACMLILLLGRHLWQLQRLARWLQQPSTTPPEAHKLWGEVFDGIYHYQRRQKADQQQIGRAHV